MEFRHLRYLVAVADSGTFSGAAEQIGVAQPALTRQLRELERELEATLFETGARRATLTPAGDAAVRGARGVLEATHAAVERARLSQQGLAGRCVIGFSRAPLMYGLPARLVQLTRERFPAITLEIVESEFRSLWEAITEGRMDVGVGQPPAAAYAALSSETQAHQVVDVAFLADDHALAQRKSVSLQDLAGLPFLWVGPDDNTSLYSKLRRELLALGVAAADMREVASTDAMTALVRGHRGWSMVPRQLGALLPPGFIAVTVEGVAIPVQFSRTWRRADHRPVTRTILDLLRELQRADRGTGTEPIDSRKPQEATFIPPRLELRHLRYFVTVVESGSFGRAAEKLELTQPALSRQVRDLEFDVGVQLLERETRGVSLTLAGASMHKDALALLSAVDEIVSSVTRISRAFAGKCHVAVLAVPQVRAVVGRAIRAWETASPGTEIAVTEMPSPRMPAAILDSTMDVGVGQGPPSAPPIEGIRRVWLADDPLDTALLPLQHPLASRESIEVRDLGDTPLLIISREFSALYHDRIIQGLAEAGFTPRLDDSFEGLNTIWSMVAAGLGWGLAAHSQRSLKLPNMAAVPVRDLKVPWGTQLLYRSDEARAPILAFIQAIQEHLAQGAEMTPPGGAPTVSPTSKAAIS